MVRSDPPEVTDMLSSKPPQSPKIRKSSSCPPSTDPENTPATTTMTMVRAFVLGLLSYCFAPVAFSMLFLYFKMVVSRTGDFEVSFESFVAAATYVIRGHDRRGSCVEQVGRIHGL